MNRAAFVTHAKWIIESLKDGRITTEPEIEHQCQWLFLIGYLFALDGPTQEQVISHLETKEGNPEAISEYYSQLLWDELPTEDSSHVN